MDATFSHHAISWMYQYPYNHPSQNKLLYQGLPYMIYLYAIGQLSSPVHISAGSRPRAEAIGKGSGPGDFITQAISHTSSLY